MFCLYSLKQNSLATDCKFISSVLSLCTCKIMRSFNLSCLIVERMYVLILRRVLNDPSLVELVADINKTSFNTFTTSDSKSRPLLVISRMYSNTSLKTASSFFPSHSNYGKLSQLTLKIGFVNVPMIEFRNQFNFSLVIFTPDTLKKQLFRV